MTSFIFMGVAGCGKSTLGSAVAKQLNLPFIEADDFHPQDNINKMSSGVALTDDDRAPWIDLLTEEVQRAHTGPAARHSVIACSALSKFVRNRLRRGLNGQVQFIHLSADSATLTARIKARENHFFDPDLLPSQFAAFSAPRRAFTLDVSQSLERLSVQARSFIETQISAANS